MAYGGYDDNLSVSNWKGFVKVMVWSTAAIAVALILMAIFLT